MAYLYHFSALILQLLKLKKIKASKHFTEIITTGTITHFACAFNRVLGKKTSIQPT